jgi:hypothetical protein
MSNRVFTHIKAGKQVKDLNGLAGVITEVIPTRLGCKIKVNINGIELEYHPRDFQAGGIIKVVEQENIR